MTARECTCIHAPEWHDSCDCGACEPNVGACSAPLYDALGTLYGECDCDAYTESPAGAQWAYVAGCDSVACCDGIPTHPIRPEYDDAAEDWACADCGHLVYEPAAEVPSRACGDCGETYVPTVTNPSTCSDCTRRGYGRQVALERFEYRRLDDYDAGIIHSDDY